MFVVKIELESLWLQFLHCYILNRWDMNVFAKISIKKCVPVFMYGLDAVSLDSNSIKLVTQV